MNPTQRLLKYKVCLAMDDLRQNRSLQTISQQELADLATKYKIMRLGTAAVQEVGEAAEVAYREHLLGISPSTHKLYIALKEGRIPKEELPNAWQIVAETLDDKEFKKTYINDHLRASTEDSIDYYSALEAILEPQIGAEMNKWGKHIVKFPQQVRTNALDLVTRLVTSSSDTLYIPEAVKAAALASQESTPLSILHYVCLRLTHDYGEPNVCPHIYEYEKVDKDGLPEKRSGRAQRYQLDTLKTIITDLNSLAPRFKQQVVIADFDIFKFGVESSKRMRENAQRYINAVQEYMGCDILVIGETALFSDEIPFNEELYMKIFNSVLLNDGLFFAHEDVRRELESYQEKKARSLNNWNADRNGYYAAASLARNAVEGVSIENGKPTIVTMFNKTSTTGSRFNLLTREKVPFFCFSPYKNNGDDLELW